MINKNKGTIQMGIIGIIYSVTGYFTADDTMKIPCFFIGMIIVFGAILIHNAKTNFESEIKCRKATESYMMRREEIPNRLMPISYINNIATMFFCGMAVGFLIQFRHFLILNIVNALIWGIGLGIWAAQPTYKYVSTYNRLLKEGRLEVGMIDRIEVMSLGMLNSIRISCTCVINDSVVNYTQIYVSSNSNITDTQKKLKVLINSEDINDFVVVLKDEDYEWY